LLLATASVGRGDSKLALCGTNHGFFVLREYQTKAVEMFIDLLDASGPQEIEPADKLFPL
jgi:hypothetical protein